MNKPPKIDRKILKTPDGFMKWGQGLLSRLQGQQNRFVPVLIAGVVLAVVFYGYDWWSGRQLEKGWRTYYEITKVTDEKKRNEQMEKFATDNSGLRPGYLAMIQLGDLHLKEAKKEALRTGGDPAKEVSAALDWYGRALGYRGLLPVEKQLVLIDRGSAYEIGKKTEEALNEYRSASEIEAEGKALALLSVGRAWEIKNDMNRATQIYEKVALEFANSEFAKAAKNNIRRLKSPLFKGITSAQG